MIAEKTGRTLGATTLKRVWGRVKYDSSPSQHTLDTLAQFVDSSSWRNFKSNLDLTDVGPAHSLGTEVTGGDPSRSRTVLGGTLALLAITTLVIFFINQGSPALADFTLSNVQFSSRKIEASGLPNSVVFSYLLTGVEADSFFIQQSWDARLRDRVSPTNTEFTSLYYYPGHFDAKLVANDQVLREHSLIVPTDGWLGLIDTDGPVPIYVELDEGQGANGLGLSIDWLSRHDTGISAGSRMLNLFNVGGFEPIGSESVILKTDIKVEIEGNPGACRKSVIVLIGEGGRVSVPFSIPGCSADLYLVAGNKEVSGRDNDLSSLGTDLSVWKSIRIGIKDRLVFVEIGGENVYQVAYSEEIGNIIGLRYRFLGKGRIKNVSLADGAGNVILEGFSD